MRERAVPLKLERRGREGDGLLIELAMPNSRPGLANRCFLSLPPSPPGYRITTMRSSARAIRSVRLRFSSSRPIFADGTRRRELSRTPSAYLPSAERFSRSPPCSVSRNRRDSFFFLHASVNINIRSFLFYFFRAG